MAVMAMRHAALFNIYREKLLIDPEFIKLLDDNYTTHFRGFEVDFNKNLKLYSKFIKYLHVNYYHGQAVFVSHDDDVVEENFYVS